MTAKNTFTKTARAAVAALIIGAASISAVPAAQAGNNNLSFGLSFNSGGGVSLSIAGSDNHRVHAKRRQGRRHCNSDWQIRSGLRDHGFSNIHFVQERRGNIKIQAQRGRWVYSMRVDRCDGQVSRIRKEHRIRRSNRSNSGQRFNNHNGFNLQWNFR